MELERSLIYDLFGKEEWTFGPCSVAGLTLHSTSPLFIHRPLHVDNFKSTVKNRRFRCSQLRLRPLYGGVG